MANRLSLKDVARTDWYFWVLMAVAVGVGIYLYPSLPDQVPTHFNLKGEPDDYSGKLFGVFFPLGMNAVLYLLLLFTPKIDPKGENFAKMMKTWTFLRLTIGLLFLGVWGVLMAAVMGYSVSFDLAFTVLFSLFFIAMGNVLGRVQPNYFMGIRTPWTLESETVWKKTHRMAGPLWVGGGFLSLILAFFGVGMEAFFVLIVAVSLIPTVYSYILYNKEKKSES